ncbi:MAG TPA: pilus assembly protein PilP [Vicinamibacterales bacterium]|nr:pilus assembly protein PilP [Vicinamibacterales bacterium]
MTRLLLATVLAAGTALSGSAQQPPAQPPAAPAAQPPVEKPASPAPTAFTYDPTGRRDPFVSLVGRGSSPEFAGTRPAGVPGMLINEISLKGIMKERSGFVALVQGPDKKTYAVRQGQRLLDGTVKSITQDTVVFSQDVNDPLSLVKQKEVRKSLRSGEESRG